MTTQTAQTSQPARKVRWWRRIFIAAACCAVLGVVVLLALPTLLSTGTGRGMIQYFAGGSLRGSLQLESLSLSWFGGQEIGGIELRDSEGKTVVRIGRVHLPDAGLWRLASGSTDIGGAAVDDVDAHLVQDADGTLNLLRALEPSDAVTDDPAAEDASSLSRGLAALPNFHLVVRNTTVSYDAPGMERVDMTMPSAELALKTGDLVTGAEATFRQGAENGSIRLKASVIGAVDASGRLQPEKAQVEADAALERLPVVVADQLANLKGRLVALLGPTLEGTLSARGQPAALDATVSLTSANLNAKAGLGMKGKTVTLAPGSALRLTMTPEAFRAFSASSPLVLERAFVCDLTLEHGAIVLGDDGPDFATSGAGASFSLGAVAVDTGERAGTLVLRDTHGQFRFDGASRSATLTFDALGEQSGRTGTIQVAARADRLLDDAGAFRTENLAASFSCAIAQFPLAIADELAGLDGLTVAALGPVLDAAVTAEYRGDAESPVHLVAKAEHFSADIAGAVLSDRIRMTKGGLVTLAVQPATLEKALRRFAPELAEDRRLTLRAPVTLRVTLDAATVPFAMATSLSEAMGGVTLEADGLKLDTGALAGPLDFAGVRLATAFDGAKGAATLDWRAVLAHGDAQSPLALRANLTKLLDERGALATAGAVGEAEMTASQLPVALLDRMAGTDGDVRLHIGETLDGALTCTLKTAPDGVAVDFHAKLEAARLKADITGQQAGDVVRVTRGSSAVFTLTPQLFASMQAAPALTSAPASALPPTFNPTLAPTGAIATIATPTTAATTATTATTAPLALEQAVAVRLVLEECQLAFPASGAEGALFDPARTRLAATVSMEAAQLRRPAENQALAIRNLVLRVAAQNPADRIELELAADITESGAAGAPARAGKIASKTLVRGAVDARGVAGTRLAVDTDTNVSNLPMDLVDALAGQKGKLAAVMGNTANVTLTGRYAAGTEGAANLTVKSPNVAVAMKGSVDGAMRFRLQEDATATLAVTPATAQFILSRINPILVNALSAQDPAERVSCILDKGLGLDLETLDPATLDARLHLRVPALIMTPGWGISGFVEALHTLGFQETRPDRFTAVFTPLESTVTRGVVTSNDLWLSSRDLMPGRIIALGTRVDRANLVTNEGVVAMGISGQTLRQLPFLAKYVSDADVFEVGARGELSNLRPDYAGLVVQFAQIRTQGQLLDKVGGSNPLASLLVGEATRLVPQVKDQKAVAARWPNRPMIVTESAPSAQPK